MNDLSDQNDPNKPTELSSFTALAQSPLFQGVSEDEIGLLVTCLGCSFRGYKKDEAVYLAGDIVREIGIVLKGCVRIVNEDTWGNSNIITEVSDGGMFAEAAVYGEMDALPVSIIASLDTQVVFANFQRIIRTCSSACAFHTMLIRNMIGELARRNIMLAGKIEHITKRTTSEKLLSYLSEQAKSKKSRSFAIPFDRQGLADYLSVERSALSAEMSKLKAAGIIDYKKNHFVLHELH